MIMMIRIVMIASKMRAFFGSLLVLSLGIMIFIQLGGKYCSCGEFNSRNRTTIAFNKLWRNFNVGDLSSIRNYSECKFKDFNLRRRRNGQKQNVEEINDIA